MSLDHIANNVAVIASLQLPDGMQITDLKDVIARSIANANDVAEVTNSAIISAPVFHFKVSQQSYNHDDLDGISPYSYFGSSDHPISPHNTHPLTSSSGKHATGEYLEDYFAHSYACVDHVSSFLTSQDVPYDFYNDVEITDEPIKASHKASRKKDNTTASTSHLPTHTSYIQIIHPYELTHPHPPTPPTNLPSYSLQYCPSSCQSTQVNDRLCALILTILLSSRNIFLSTTAQTKDPSRRSLFLHHLLQSQYITDKNTIQNPETQLLAYDPINSTSTSSVFYSCFHRDPNELLSQQNGDDDPMRGQTNNLVVKMDTNNEKKGEPSNCFAGHDMTHDDYFTTTSTFLRDISKVRRLYPDKDVSRNSGIPVNSILTPNETMQLLTYLLYKHQLSTNDSMEGEDMQLSNKNNDHTRYQHPPPSIAPPFPLDSIRIHTERSLSLFSLGIDNLSVLYPGKTPFARYSLLTLMAASVLQSFRDSSLGHIMCSNKYGDSKLQRHPRSLMSLGVPDVLWKKCQIPTETIFADNFSYLNKCYELYLKSREKVTSYKNSLGEGHDEEAAETAASILQSTFALHEKQFSNWFLTNPPRHNAYYLSQEQFLRYLQLNSGVNSAALKTLQDYQLIDREITMLTFPSMYWNRKVGLGAFVNHYISFFDVHAFGALQVSREGVYDPHSPSLSRVYRSYLPTPDQYSVDDLPQPDGKSPSGHRIPPAKQSSFRVLTHTMEPLQLGDGRFATTYPGLIDIAPITGVILNTMSSGSLDSIGSESPIIDYNTLAGRALHDDHAHFSQDAPGRSLTGKKSKSTAATLTLPTSIVYTTTLRASHKMRQYSLQCHETDQQQAQQQEQPSSQTTRRSKQHNVCGESSTRGVHQINNIPHLYSSADVVDYVVNANINGESMAFFCHFFAALASNNIRLKYPHLAAKYPYKNHTYGEVLSRISTLSTSPHLKWNAEQLNLFILLIQKLSCAYEITTTFFFEHYPYQMNTQAPHYSNLLYSYQTPKPPHKVKPVVGVLTPDDMLRVIDHAHAQGGDEDSHDNDDANGMGDMPPDDDGNVEHDSDHGGDAISMDRSMNSRGSVRQRRRRRSIKAEAEVKAEIDNSREAPQNRTPLRRTSQRNQGTPIKMENDTITDSNEMEHPKSMVTPRRRSSAINGTPQRANASKQKHIQDYMSTADISSISTDPPEANAFLDSHNLYRLARSVLTHDHALMTIRFSVVYGAQKIFSELARRALIRKGGFRTMAGIHVQQCVVVQHPIRMISSTAENEVNKAMSHVTTPYPNAQFTVTVYSMPQRTLAYQHNLNTPAIPPQALPSSSWWRADIHNQPALQHLSHTLPTDKAVNNPYFIPLTNCYQPQQHALSQPRRLVILPLTPSPRRGMPPPPLSLHNPYMPLPHSLYRIMGASIHTPHGYINRTSAQLLRPVDPSLLTRLHAQFQKEGGLMYRDMEYHKNIGNSYAFYHIKHVAPDNQQGNIIRHTFQKLVAGPRRRTQNDHVGLFQGSGGSSKQGGGDPSFVAHGLLDHGQAGSTFVVSDDEEEFNSDIDDSDLDDDDSALLGMTSSDSSDDDSGDDDDDDDDEHSEEDSAQPSKKQSHRRQKPRQRSVLAQDQELAPSSFAESPTKQGVEDASSTQFLGGLPEVPMFDTFHDDVDMLLPSSLASPHPADDQDSNNVDPPALDTTGDHLLHLLQVRETPNASSAQIPIKSETDVGSNESILPSPSSPGRQSLQSSMAANDNIKQDDDLKRDLDDSLPRQQQPYLSIHSLLGIVRQQYPVLTAALLLCKLPVQYYDTFPLVKRHMVIKHSMPLCNFLSLYSDDTTPYKASPVYHTLLRSGGRTPLITVKPMRVPHQIVTTSLYEGYCQSIFRLAESLATSLRLHNTFHVEHMKLCPRFLKDPSSPCLNTRTFGPSIELDLNSSATAHGENTGPKTSALNRSLPETLDSTSTGTLPSIDKLQVLLRLFGQMWLQGSSSVSSMGAGRSGYYHIQDFCEDGDSQPISVCNQVVKSIVPRYEPDDFCLQYGASSGETVIPEKRSNPTAFMTEMLDRHHNMPPYTPEDTESAKSLTDIIIASVNDFSIEQQTKLEALASGDGSMANHRQPPEETMPSASPDGASLDAALNEATDGRDDHDPIVSRRRMASSTPTTDNSPVVTLPITLPLSLPQSALNANDTLGEGAGLAPILTAMTHDGPISAKRKRRYDLDSITVGDHAATMGDTDADEMSFDIGTLTAENPTRQVTLLKNYIPDEALGAQDVSAPHTKWYQCMVLYRYITTLYRLFMHYAATKKSYQEHLQHSELGPDFHQSASDIPAAPAGLPQMRCEYIPPLSTTLLVFMMPLSVVNILFDTAAFDQRVVTYPNQNCPLWQLPPDVIDSLPFSFINSNLRLLIKSLNIYGLIHPVNVDSTSLLTGVWSCGCYGSIGVDGTSPIRCDEDTHDHKQSGNEGAAGRGTTGTKSVPPRQASPHPLTGFLPMQRTMEILPSDAPSAIISKLFRYPLADATIFNDASQYALSTTKRFSSEQRAVLHRDVLLVPAQFSILDNVMYSMLDDTATESLPHSCGDSATAAALAKSYLGQCLKQVIQPTSTLDHFNNAIDVSISTRTSTILSDNLHKTATDSHSHDQTHRVGITGGDITGGETGIDLLFATHKQLYQYRLANSTRIAHILGNLTGLPPVILKYLTSSHAWEQTPLKAHTDENSVDVISMLSTVKAMMSESTLCRPRMLPLYLSPSLLSSVDIVHHDAASPTAGLLDTNRTSHTMTPNAMPTFQPNPYHTLFLHHGLLNDRHLEDILPSASLRCVYLLRFLFPPIKQGESLIHRHHDQMRRNQQDLDLKTYPLPSIDECLQLPGSTSRKTSQHSSQSAQWHAIEIDQDFLTPLSESLLPTNPLAQVLSVIMAPQETLHEFQAACIAMTHQPAVPLSEQLLTASDFWSAISTTPPTQTFKTSMMTAHIKTISSLRSLHMLKYMVDMALFLRPLVNELVGHILAFERFLCEQMNGLTKRGYFADRLNSSSKSSGTSQPTASQHATTPTRHQPTRGVARGASTQARRAQSQEPDRPSEKGAMRSHDANIYDMVFASYTTTNTGSPAASAQPFATYTAISPEIIRLRSQITGHIMSIFAAVIPLLNPLYCSMQTQTLRQVSGQAGLGPYKLYHHIHECMSVSDIPSAFALYNHYLRFQVRQAFLVPRVIGFPLSLSSLIFQTPRLYLKMCVFLSFIARHYVYNVQSSEERQSVSAITPLFLQSTSQHDMKAAHTIQQFIADKRDYMSLLTPGLSLLSIVCPFVIPLRIRGTTDAAHKTRSTSASKPAGTPASPDIWLVYTPFPRKLLLFDSLFYAFIYFQFNSIKSSLSDRSSLSSSVTVSLPDGYHGVSYVSRRGINPSTLLHALDPFIPLAAAVAPSAQVPSIASSWDTPCPLHNYIAYSSCPCGHADASLVRFLSAKSCPARSILNGLEPVRLALKGFALPYVDSKSIIPGILTMNYILRTIDDHIRRRLHTAVEGPQSPTQDRLDEGSIVDIVSIQRQKMLQTYYPSHWKPQHNNPGGVSPTVQTHHTTTSAQCGLSFDQFFPPEHSLSRFMLTCSSTIFDHLPAQGIGSPATMLESVKSNIQCTLVLVSPHQSQPLSDQRGLSKSATEASIQPTISQDKDAKTTTIPVAMQAIDWLVSYTSTPLSTGIESHHSITHRPFPMLIDITVPQGDANAADTILTTTDVDTTTSLRLQLPVYPHIPAAPYYEDTTLYSLTPLDQRILPPSAVFNPASNDAAAHHQYQQHGHQNPFAVGHSGQLPNTIDGLGDTQINQNPPDQIPFYDLFMTESYSHDMMDAEDETFFQLPDLLAEAGSDDDSDSNHGM